MPIIILTLTSSDILDNNHETVLKIIKRLDIQVYEMYKDYRIHCWEMDTEDKCSKWGLNSMKLKGAHSTTTNITSTESNKDILMIYHYKNELILSPWNGSITANK